MVDICSSLNEYYFYNLDWLVGLLLAGDALGFEVIATAIVSFPLE